MNFRNRPEEHGQSALARVFGEQFEVRAGSAAPQPTRREPVASLSEAPLASAPSATGEAPAQGLNPEALSAGASQPSAPLAGAAQMHPVAAPQLSPEQKPVPAPQVSGAMVESEGKGQLASERVQNPQHPEAAYAVKGQGEKKKEHLGYKMQVAETVCEAVLAPGEPTRNFLMGIVTQPTSSPPLAPSQVFLEQTTVKRPAAGAFQPGRVLNVLSAPGQLLAASDMDEE